MNFTEYDCDNEEILELLSHLPITTVDDYQWMQKYIDDLQLHYEKGEYELAVISAHMIYMFIVYCYILKKKEFDINIIKADFHCDKEHCPQKQTDISPYLYVYKGDKKCFTHLKLDTNLKNQHNKAVDIRDSIAHCSGNVLIQTDFIDYLRKCIRNIIQVKNIIWNNFKQSKKFNQAIQSMVDWNDIIPVFLISRREFEDLFEEKISNVIKEKLSDISFWQDMIDNTIPANYGINDYEFIVETININYDTIDNDIITGTFNADINIFLLLQMASSNPDDGYEENYNKLHQINGYFYCEHNLNEFNITIDDMPVLDLLK